MAETCVEAESAVNFDQLYAATRNSTLEKIGHLSISESIASSAVKTAIDIEAKAIVVCSESGNTASQVAKFRSGRPIMVLTTNEQVARQCYGVLKGCRSIVLPSLKETDAAVTQTIEGFKCDGVVKAGDAIVVVQGFSDAVGATNTMRIQYA